MSNNRFGICSALVALCVVGPAPAQQAYTLTDLGTYGSYNVFLGGAVNNYGKAAVTADKGSTGNNLSFYWDGSALSFLPGPGGLNGWSGVSAINDAGWIVGNAKSTAGGNSSAVLWRNGVLTNLTGKSTSSAGGINNLASPQITGSVAVGKSTQAFLWQAGKYTTLPFSGGTAINNLGQIAGGDAIGPLFWSTNTGVVHLNIGAGTQGTRVVAINDSGLIAGVIETYDGTRFSGQGVVWNGPTGQVAYYLPSVNPASINSAGVVIGSQYIWDAVNGTRNLNTLLDSSGAGWTIYQATSISDTGYILAIATSVSVGYIGEDRIVLLTPK